MLRGKGRSSDVGEWGSRGELVEGASAGQEEAGDGKM